MRFIEDQFSKRMKTKKIDFENKKRIVIDDGYTFYWLNNKIQYDFNSDYIKPSVFYAVAKEVDLKFSEYYHQNLSIENYPYTNEYKSGYIHFIFDVEEKEL